MKNNTAVFPGSFDPITIGHVDIVKKGLKIFDKIIIAIGNNDNKEYMFKLKKRIHFIELVFKLENRITVKSYNNLTISFCEQEKASHIIRGIRNVYDYEYEKNIAINNSKLNPNIETIFLQSKECNNTISSTLVKDLITNKNDTKNKLDLFIPKEILTQIN